MTSRPAWRWHLLPIGVGVMAAALWVWFVGGEAIGATLQRVDPVVAIWLVVSTAGWFGLRFIRSQFLLRYAGVRVPIRPALATYLAALPGTATPAYLGESIRSIFLRRRFGAPVPTTLVVLLVERMHDVAALALLAALVPGPTHPAVGWGFLAAVLLGGLALRRALSTTGMARIARSILSSAPVLLPAFLLSLLAWGGAGLTYWLAGRALALPVGIATGVDVFAGSTLLGALTLLPAGFGATGSAAILELEAILPAADAVALVTLVRLGTTGVAMLVGAFFLVRELRGEPAAAEGVAHFDDIAAEYAAQWSPHVWDLLLQRKMGFMCEALGEGPQAGIGLDLGCGLGLQTGEMRRRGYRVLGLEPSVGLLRQRPDRGTPVLAGDGMRLPFADRSLDFVFVIGVLHHLPGRAAQAEAFREIARVLRPGGRLLVHESNPRNPLFRFYMTYAFPILKRIDEGTEWWIHPDTWSAVPGLALERIRYFTFLPDFIPRVLMRPALAIERLLEDGPTYPYSAHYFAVLRRDALTMPATAGSGTLSDPPRPRPAA